MDSFKTRGDRSRTNTISKKSQKEHLSVEIHPCDIIITNSDTYQNESMTKLNQRLNESKDQLDQYYIGAKTDKKMQTVWNNFQGIVDIYKELRGTIANNYNAKHVTNAWMKYWEIYNQYNILPGRDWNRKNKRPYIAFMNAELPGAALCAFNHYMKTVSKGTKFNWRASSLAPEQDNKDVLGDYYGLYRHNKNHWLMGGNNGNGDMTNTANIRALANRIGLLSSTGGVDMYSHDAGVDVAVDENGNLSFNNQELLNAKLHFGCALAGFVIMRKGANFIAKQYTLFDTFTWNCILLYSGLFEKFYLCKPLTSRPYNSEIYLVGLGFKGLPARIEEFMYERLDNFTTAPFLDQSIQKTVSAQNVFTFADIMFNQQIEILDQNITLFEKYRMNIMELAKCLRVMKKEKNVEWLKKYPINIISDFDQLKSNGERKR